MPAYLSHAWFAAADRALRADPALQELSRRSDLVLQQIVTDAERTTAWYVRFADGKVSLDEGEAADAAVTFTCDRATAEAVSDGRLSAQAAFMAGQLVVGGDVGALLRHQALLTGLTDALAPLRASAA